MTPAATGVAPVREPLFWAALFFALGILGGVHAWRPPAWWAASSCVLMAAAIFWRARRPRVAIAAGLTAIAVLGALDAQGVAPCDTRILEFDDGREVRVTAHVSRDGTVRRGAFGGLVEVVDLEAEEASAAALAPRPLNSGLRVTVYARERGPRAAGIPLYRYGQRLRFTAKLRPPRNFKNPGAFDYRGYLQENGIVALASTDVGSVEVLPGFVGSRPAAWLGRLRQRVIQQVNRTWPPRQAALVDAMVIGEDAFIDRDTRLDFQRSGTYHILVVSGMNLAILALVLFWALRRLRLREAACSLITIIFSFGYAALCDFGAPILRAALMLCLYLGSRLVFRRASSLNALGGAALALLAASPRALFSPSFQLTFLCVLAIGGIAGPLLERWVEPPRRALRNLDATGVDVSLTPQLAQFRLDLRLIRDRLARFIGRRLATPLLTGGMRLCIGLGSVVFISALMQITLALPMAWYFHRLNSLSVPANVLVVPLAELLMPATLLALVVGAFWLPLAKAPAMLAGWALDVIDGTVHTLGTTPVSDLRLPTPGTSLALATAVALALALLCARRRWPVAMAALAALGVTASLLAVVPRRPNLHPNVLEITAIDVGQGDSTLVISPQGKALLVDGGGPTGGAHSDFDFGEDVVSPYLWSRGISRLDAVMLTHAHADHISGLYSVIRNFRPHELWVGANPDVASIRRLLNAAAEQKASLRRLAQAGSFDFGGSLVTVLGPPLGWEPGPEPRNNDSVVVRVSYGGTSAILPGDAERAMESAIAARGIHADLVKVAHNGSRTSTGTDLLQTLRPRFGVISVGARNSYRHPVAEVLARLQNSGVSTYRTDLHGAVTFYLDGKTVTPAAR